MQIIPVIDLKQGLVVRAVAGRRDEYRPIDSRLVDSAQPGVIAHAFVTEFGFTTAYVADLDAIAGAEPDWQTYAAIAAAGLLLWVDAGVGDVDRASRFNEINTVKAVVVGLETLPSIGSLRLIVGELGAERVIFSLDLMHGKPRTIVDAWRFTSPLDIVKEVTQLGVRQFIVLDLADVGMCGGVSTLQLARVLCAQSPELQLVGGGGVRHQRDLEEMADAGYRAALIASALHEGRFLRNSQ